MNILFLTRHDTKNINLWSGTCFHMYKKLKEKHHVLVIGTEILNQVYHFSKGNFSKDYFLPVDSYAKI